MVWHRAGRAAVFERDILCSPTIVGADCLTVAIFAIQKPKQGGICRYFLIVIEPQLPNLQWFCNTYTPIYAFLKG